MSKQLSEAKRLKELGSRIKTVDDALAIFGVPGTVDIQEHPAPRGKGKRAAPPERVRILVWYEISGEYYAKGLVNNDGALQLTFVAKRAELGDSPP